MRLTVTYCFLLLTAWFMWPREAIGVGSKTVRSEDSPVTIELTFDESEVCLDDGQRNILAASLAKNPIPDSARIAIVAEADTTKKKRLGPKTRRQNCIEELFLPFTPTEGNQRIALLRAVIVFRKLLELQPSLIPKGQPSVKAIDDEVIRKQKSKQIDSTAYQGIINQLQTYVNRQSDSIELVLFVHRIAQGAEHRRVRIRWIIPSDSKEEGADKTIQPGAKITPIPQPQAQIPPIAPLLLPFGVGAEIDRALSDRASKLQLREMESLARLVLEGLEIQARSSRRTGSIFAISLGASVAIAGSIMLGLGQQIEPRYAPTIEQIDALNTRQLGLNASGGLLLSLGTASLVSGIVICAYSCKSILPSKK